MNAFIEKYEEMLSLKAPAEQDEADDTLAYGQFDPWLKEVLKLATEGGKSGKSRRRKKRFGRASEQARTNRRQGQKSPKGHVGSGRNKDPLDDCNYA